MNETPPKNGFPTKEVLFFGGIALLLWWLLKKIKGPSLGVGKGFFFKRKLSLYKKGVGGICSIDIHISSDPVGGFTLQKVNGAKRVPITLKDALDSLCQEASITVSGAVKLGVLEDMYRVFISSGYKVASIVRGQDHSQLVSLTKVQIADWERMGYSPELIFAESLQRLFSYKQGKSPTKQPVWLQSVTQYRKTLAS